MSTRQTGQMSLADSLARRGGRSEAFLQRVAGLIDWLALEEALRPIARARTGAPGYPPLLMLKAMLLQQWYGLSDPALEDALADRLSFRRFVGLSLDEAAPDHSTLSRFRKALVEHGLTERVFDVILHQIAKRNLVLRQGTMIDATLIEAAVRRPKPPADAPPGPTKAHPNDTIDPPADGATPLPRLPGKLVNSEIDPDARWAKKGGKRTFGYKGHVGVDRLSGIIRTRLFTSAAVADTTPADGLICGDERAVYADAAYDTHARRAALKAKGVQDRIAHRPNKHHALTRWQAHRNDGIAHRRSGVERVFAMAKTLMRWSRVRYIGLARNAGHFDLICTAINIRRLTVLAP